MSVSQLGPASPNPESMRRAEVVTDSDIVHILYAKQNVSSVLRRFAFGQPYSDEDTRIVDETDIDAAFADYAADVAKFAVRDGDINVGLVREAFGVINTDMNIIAGEKFGFERSRTVQRWLFERLGVRVPGLRTYLPRHPYFPSLGDLYWHKQFLKQYEAQELTHKLPDEPDEQYLTRYLRSCLYGFVLPNFSYIQQATSAA